MNRKKINQVYVTSWIGLMKYQKNLFNKKINVPTGKIHFTKNEIFKITSEELSNHIIVCFENKIPIIPLDNRTNENLELIDVSSFSEFEKWINK